MARLTAAVTGLRRTLLTGVLFLLGCLHVLAQTGTITGKVNNAAGKNPLAGASVFLNNATYGTTTAADGSFTLRNVKPGQYQLVVTNVGFEDYNKTIMVGGEGITLNIDMVYKVTELRPVIISTNADWKKNYAQFKKEFIGTSKNSEKCVVVNPRAVSLAYYSSRLTLEAFTDEFLVVENHALGYRVKFLIKDFKSDGNESTVSYEGKALFEELPGSASQKAKWKAIREDVYYGSSKHFYRSLIAGKLEQDSFIVKRFTRELNPARPPEGMIQKKIKKFKYTNRDSLSYWIGLANLPRFYKEKLWEPSLSIYQLIYNTQQPGIFALGAQDYLLYVIYTKKREETFFKDIYYPLDLPNYQITVLTLRDHVAYFDNNGTVIAEPPLYEGTWSKSKLAEMLPVDYVPGD